MGEPVKDAATLLEEAADMITERSAEHAQACRQAAVALAPVPLGYVLIELDRVNNLTARIKALAEAGSADAKSLAADVALLLEARRG